MFEEGQAAFHPPRNVHSRIWRYMDFTQFVALLDSRCLHFTRPDKFKDQFEGCMPERLRKEFHAADFDESAKTALMHLFRSKRETTCVNCWHRNPHESAAMWELYLKSDEGIAVCSTYDRLTKSFTDDPDVAVHVGIVKYRDYEKDSLPMDDFFSLLLHKRRSFSHEREIRAIAIEVTRPEGMGYLWKHQPIDPAGKNVAVDVSVLIEEVYVAPKMHTWFKTLVERVVAQYGFSFAVRQSNLDKDPVW